MQIPLYGEKKSYIGPVDPEIIWLKLKKTHMIYSPVGKFAERANKEKQNNSRIYSLLDRQDGRAK